MPQLYISVHHNNSNTLLNVHTHTHTHTHTHAQRTTDTVQVASVQVHSMCSVTAVEGKTPPPHVAGYGVPVDMHQGIVDSTSVCKL